ncbi:MAG: hypothetical protein QNK16_04365 [Woeseiaceae bacterium]|nr:hypothetical protein [Woeseiaceae bacterium]MDX2607595.1 hypothetical protein [Woeseiaceae bacterium]
MKILATSALAVAVLFASNAFAQDYVMSCDDVVKKLNREATAAAKDRFADLKGSCLGVVDRNGALYMHTNAVVRRAGRQSVTLYLPATDRTFKVEPKAESRVIMDGRKVRPSRLLKGDKLDIYVPVDAFTQPVIQEVALPTAEPDEIIEVPAVRVAALPTTG